MDKIPQKKNPKTFKDLISAKCQVNVEIDYGITFPTNNSNIILDNLDVHNDEINIQAIENSESLPFHQEIIFKEKLNKIKNKVTILTCDQLNNSIDKINAQSNTKLAIGQTQSSENKLNETIPDKNPPNIENKELKIHTTTYEQPKAVKRKLEERNDKDKSEHKTTTGDLNDLVTDHNNSIKGDSFAIDDLAEDYTNAIDKALGSNKHNDNTQKDSETEQKKILFSCYICDKLFVERRLLITHISSHKNKAFVIDILTEKSSDQENESEEESEVDSELITDDDDSDSSAEEVSSSDQEDSSSDDSDSIEILNTDQQEENEDGETTDVEDSITIKEEPI